MAFTPTTQNTQPVVGASADTWGGIINARLQEVYADFIAIATQFNATQIIAAAALPKAGGTLTGDVVVGDPTPAGADSIGLRGLPVVSIDADHTFVAKDAGKCRRLTGTTTRTWTIPPNVVAVGQVIVVRNAGTANLTLARGSGVALRIPGSTTDSNKTVAGSGFVSLLQEDTNVWVVSGTGVA